MRVDADVEPDGAVEAGALLEEDVLELADLVVEVMEGALPLDVPLEVDLKVGENWEQMDRYLRSEGAWRRVPKSAGDVAREEAEEEVAAALAS